LVLAFDLRQLIPQPRSFGAILFSFNTGLDGNDIAHPVNHLDDGPALALAGMCKLIDEIVLVQGLGLEFVDTTVKIPDARPALSLRDDRIADRDSGILPLPSIVLQIVGENLEIVLALPISLVGCQTIPSQNRLAQVSVREPSLFSCAKLGRNFISVCAVGRSING
jgi:hypothetical protein